MLALTPPPDRAIPVLWQNFIRTFNVPGRLDTVPSAHSRALTSVRFLPQTRTPLYVGAKCGRPHRGSNRALTTGTSVEFLCFYPLGHGGDGRKDTSAYLFRGRGIKKHPKVIRPADGRKVVRGHNVKTVVPIELKFAQRSSAPQIYS